LKTKFSLSYAPLFFNFAVRPKKETLIKNIKDLEDLKIKAESIYSQFSPTLKYSLKYTVFVNIVNKLISILNELNNNQNDLHKQSITLRYCLEATIISKLFIIEKNYFLKFYYALNSQHEKKIQISIDRINSEILFLQNLNTSSSKEVKKIHTNIHVYIDDHDIDKYSLTDLVFLLKDKLAFYKKSLKDIQELKKKEIKELSTEALFTEYFNQENQYTKILKQLEDKRGWKEKSINAGLEKEYILTYESTSSLLHFTSFSIFTEHDIGKNEVKENYSLISQYIKKVINNLEEFIECKNIEVIQV